MSIFGPVPGISGMRKMRFRAKSLKKYENAWFPACPALHCPPRIAQNVPTVFAFVRKHALEKADVGFRSPKTSLVNLPSSRT